MCVCVYEYTYMVKSSPACSLTKYKIEKNYIISSYFHWTFRIALNSFSTVKSLNSATALTKN